MSIDVTLQIKNVLFSIQQFKIWNNSEALAGKQMYTRKAAHCRVFPILIVCHIKTLKSLDMTNSNQLGIT